jgi:hypothetical protein
MATRTAYITVRIDIDNPKKREITDDDVDDIVNKIYYHFCNVGDFSLETEICGLNEDYDEYEENREIRHL